MNSRVLYFIILLGVLPEISHAVEKNLEAQLAETKSRLQQETVLNGELKSKYADIEEKIASLKERAKALEEEVEKLKGEIEE